MTLRGDRAQSAFRALSAAAVVAAFGQVTLGGVVRVTGSGLGCPDWPLCHGRLIPPFDAATLIEYSHRLSGSLLGLLVIAGAVIAWTSYRRSKLVLYPMVGAVVLVVVAGALGGVTVLTELEWWARLIHLALAEALIACVIVAAVEGWHRGPAPSRDRRRPGGMLLHAALLGMFILILSGSFMVGYGAGSSCGTWPLCRGSLFPQGAAYAVHMGHRYLAAIVGVVVLAAAWGVWTRAAAYPSVRAAAAGTAAVLLAQTLVGAVVVWAGFTAEMRAAHLSMATLAWVALLLMTALLYSRRREVSMGGVE